MFKINRNLQITEQIYSKAVTHAIENLRRDIEKTCTMTDEAGCELILERAELEAEQFHLICAGNAMILGASDELGFVYGIYHISRQILGIENFWFWNDQVIQQQASISVPENYAYESKPHAVRYRGWFVNDEVLIHTWSLDGSQDKPWEMVFETLLRCGGNMTIPGTDHNSEKYRRMASDMGLYITHHHAEPLGAPMFARRYPDLTASYEQYPEKFQQLWREGIEAQQGMKVIWNIGFRGQGDCPFWENDPKYDTPESRGKLMSELMEKQYHMVQEYDKNAAFCTNLYGETMELYRGGYLKIPDDVTKIWADNGYGKMVTRRQNNHNPRVYALPDITNNGSHGIYYHVSFYDLQAANHMTMMPNSPEFVCQELEDVMRHGADDFWIINCSNVKPHVYYLDLIAQFWRDGYVNVEQHRADYVGTYYGKKHAETIKGLLQDYHKYSVSFGMHEDEHAGEQYSNHVARMLVTQFVQNKEQHSIDLEWALKGAHLMDQVALYQNICRKAKDSYEQYLLDCEKEALELEGSTRRLFEDTILLQAQIHTNCYRGAYAMCQSLQNAFEKKYREAFYDAGCAREYYLAADKAMRDREHGKWHNFYQNECLTDMKQTAWVLQSYMSYIRILGDGPHFYEWQREFLYSEEDRRVMLIMNMENHLTDLEIFALMKEKKEN